jgi:tetratricopeptide (TPR) repeat protein
MERSQAIFGTRHRYMLNDILKVAEQAHLAGHSSEAEALYQLAIEIIDEHPGQEEYYRADALRGLARTRRSARRLADAEAFYRQAMLLDERRREGYDEFDELDIFGSKRIATARDLNNLGVILKELGQSAEAMSLWLRALRIVRHFNSAEDEIATILNNQASLLRESGRVSRADRLMQRVLAIDRELGHDCVARHLNPGSQLIRLPNTETLEHLDVLASEDRSVVQHGEKLRVEAGSQMIEFLRQLWGDPASLLFEYIQRVRGGGSSDQERAHFRHPHYVFISYRRDDSDFTQLIVDRLSARFGRDTVYFDRTRLRLGADFPEELTRAVSATRVFVAIIGSNWLGQKANSKMRRIDEPGDWVRREVELALAHSKKIIPVFRNRNGFPRELPEAIARLRDINGITVDSSSDFEYHISTLCDEISKG